jgi:hypothetical protein
MYLTIHVLCTNHVRSHRVLTLGNNSHYSYTHVVVKLGKFLITLLCLNTHSCVYVHGRS